MTKNEEEFERELIDFIENKNIWKPFNSSDIKSDWTNSNNNGFYYLHKQIFETKIKELNKNIESKYLDKAIVRIKDIVKDSNSELAKYYAYNAFLNGITVNNDDKTKTSPTIKIIDFENWANNDFSFTHQLKIKSRHPEFNYQIPDIVFYINGLPVIIGELKSPELEEDEWQKNAVYQIKNYKFYCDQSLFAFNILNFISNRTISKYSSPTNDVLSYYYPWKNWNTKEENTWKTFFEGILNPKIILELLKDFSFYWDEDKSKSTRILASYHQYYGVNEAFDKAKDVYENNDNKIGIFWHTQGSGKSYSMIFFNHKIISYRSKVTTLVITDRKDLDNQLFNTFSKAARFLNQKVVSIKSIEDLKTSLKDKQQNDIFFSTVQKFDKTIGLLSEREDILIISDEAHRSHRNSEKNSTEIKFWSLKDQLLNNENEDEHFSFAAFLRKAFPNAKFIGFTGTPIETDSYRTTDTFGDYVSKYLMTQATEDGFVVPINYQYMKNDMNINGDKGEEIIYEAQQKYEYIIESFNAKFGDGDIVKNKLDNEIKKLENFLEIDERIENIVNHFIHHYESRQNILKGKAMFVAWNRKIALKYYQKILAKRPEWKDKVQLIVSVGSSSSEDPELVEIAVPDGAKKTEAANNFKKNDNPFKIAIVVDMWLTGFDVPALDTLYLDSYLKMHNLMQTIARVNRNYEDDENHKKEAGLIVDYIGIIKELKKAIKFYTDEDEIKLREENQFTDIEQIKISLEELVEKVTQEFGLNKEEILKAYYDSEINGHFRYETVFEHLIITKVLEKSKLEEDAPIIKRFNTLCADIKKYWKITISILDKEFSLFCKMLYASSTILKDNLIQKSEYDPTVAIKIKEKIMSAISMDTPISFDDIEVNLKDLKINDIVGSLLKETGNSNEILQKYKDMSQVDLYLKSISKANNTKINKLAMDIKALMEKYKNNLLTREEFIKDFQTLSKDELASENNLDQMKLTNNIEKQFYTILNNTHPDLRSDYDNEKIKIILEELYDCIKNRINSTWRENNKMKNEVKGNLRRILIKHNFPPNIINQARDEIAIGITQAIEDANSLEEIFPNLKNNNGVDHE